jgi:hypothetical protein
MVPAPLGADHSPGCAESVLPTVGWAGVVMVGVVVFSGALWW